MRLELQVFAPVTLAYRPLGFPLLPATRHQLLRQGWEALKDRTSLTLVGTFFDYHEVFVRDVSDVLMQQPQPHGHACKVHRKEAELWYQSTGILLVSATYQLETDQFSPRLGSLYADLTRREEDGGHFHAFFRSVVERLHGYLGKLALASDQQRDPADPAKLHAVPQWTHGIYVSVTEPTDHLLSEDQLECLTHSPIVQDHHAGEIRLRGRFGWETTSVTTNSAREAVAFSELMKLLGYIWQVHFVLDDRASKRLSHVPTASRKELTEMRELRGRTTLLLDACHITRLTMVERHFHIVKAVMQEWHLADIRSSIDHAAELLDVMMSESNQEQVDQKMWRISLVLAVLTLGAVVSATTDTIEFFHSHRDSLGIARTALELFGPLAALLMLSWIFFKWRSR